MSKSISLKAYAKINLCLDITGILPDSYHSIKGVFQSVSIHDIVNISLNNTGNITVIADNGEIPSGEKNIAYKAAKKFFERSASNELGADIEIRKGIPSQAGMGGGSADAAAVLNGLNMLTGCKLTQEQLCEIGAGIGADVPFCITGNTVLCEGIGEIMTPLPSVSDANPDLYLCIGKGSNGISTAEAYKKFDSRNDIIHPDTDRIVEYLKKNELHNTYNLLANTFEQLTELDDIDVIKDIMIRHNAGVSLMTGSGSAVFGIFPDKSTAAECCETLKNKGYFSRVCTFTNRGFDEI